MTSRSSGQVLCMQHDVERELRELHEQHRHLTAQLAETAEYSAQVHDEAARVHESLPDPQLDPVELRAHAERDRAFAAEERRRLQESLQED